MHNSGIGILIFVVFSLLIGAVLKALMRSSRMPYTVILLLVGIGIGAINHFFFADTQNVFSTMIHQVGEIDPHLILFLFLPTLIFESAYSMEPHLFFRILPQIALLAIVGLIISMVLSAFAVHWLLSWSIGASLLFGALISATDPVAVVALLKEKSSRKRLETLIDGESLLNDGTAIVFFTLFYGFALGTTTEVHSLGVVAEFVWVVSAGLAIGVVIGWLSLSMIGKLINQPLIEITVSIASAYMTFFIAEYFHVSGVVALVALALMYSTLGRTRISPEISHFLHQFWEMLSYLANTLIFLIVGIVIISHTKFDTPELWGMLLLLYVFLMIIRGVSVVMLMPILERIGVGITKEKATVVIWGGLRGAVSLSLALSLAQDTNMPAALREQILFLTAGIVFLSIVINGSSMEWLLQKLHLDKLPAAKELSVRKAQHEINEQMQSFFKTLRHNPFFDKVKFDSLDVLLNKEKKLSEKVEQEDMEVAFMRRLLEIERSDYWRQFEEGHIGRQATFILSRSIEQALDNTPQITPRPILEELFGAHTAPKWMNSVPFMRGYVSDWRFTYLSLSYDVARGFITAQDEIELYVRELQPSQESGDKIRDMIEKNRSMTFSYIHHIAKEYPELITQLQSKAAKRLLLNHERSLIWQMEHEGVLENAEAQHLIDNIEAKMRSNRSSEA